MSLPDPAPEFQTQNWLRPHCYRIGCCWQELQESTSEIVSGAIVDWFSSAVASLEPANKPVCVCPLPGFDQLKVWEQQDLSVGWFAQIV